MPLYDYLCEECGYGKEHFVMNVEVKKTCPKCNSKDYQRQLGAFALDVQYGNVEDIMENRINPSVEATHAKIGREALDQDCKTLENVYGKEKVERTFYGSDD